MIKLYDYLKNNKVYIIAEMSGNHGGDLKKALEIVDAAKEAGADCLKIQTYTAYTITIDCQNDEFKTSGLWSGSYMYKLYQKAYTPWEWTKELKSRAESLGLDFLSTPFDFTAVDFLEDCGLEFYKIASPEIVDLPLIKKVALTKKPLVLSCGMATEAEIREAVDTYKKYSDNIIVLLKCCSAYPSNYDDMNIVTIKDMIDKFNLPVGLSDHSYGIVASLSAVCLGAKVIEKHFCISREDHTVDSDFSLNVKEFKELVENIRNVEKALGKVRYGCLDSEKGSYNGRRSLYVVKDIKKGEKFTSDNIRSIRPSKGLHTKYYEFLINSAHAKCDLKFGTPLSSDVIVENLEVL